MEITDFEKILDEINKHNICIIGHMGSGKSIIGARLAKYFNLKHIDTDKEIEKNEKITIKEIFETKGEQYFRKIESKIVQKILKKRNIVISLGGGSILMKNVRINVKRKKFLSIIF